MYLFSICSLIFSLFLSSTLITILGIYYLIIDYSVFAEWELSILNGSIVGITLIWDWMSLIFISLVIYISYLVIYYSENYITDETNMNCFINIILIFIPSFTTLSDVK